MSELIPAKQRSRRNALKVVRRLLLLAAFLYCLPLILLAAFQRLLIFDAPATHTGSAATPPGARLIWLRTRHGDRFEAYYGHACLADGTEDRDYSRRPTLLFFGGKGSSIAPERGLFQSFRRLDANVLMPEYVGFGHSDGQESETNCFATAQASYNFLRSQPDINQKRLVIAGYSLGSGVAIHLTADAITAKQPVAGLALFAPYTSMAAMAHQEYPIYPFWLLRLILRYPFASDTKMPIINCPVLLVHSQADTLIPGWMSDTLTALCRGPVTRLTVTHANHAEYFSNRETTVSPALRQFLEKTSHETYAH